MLPGATELQETSGILSGPELFHFAPSAKRVRFLDQRMRSDLANSLRYLVSVLEPHLALDQPGIDAFLARLEKAPTPPLTLAIYSDLVFATEASDLLAAQRLVSLLVSQPDHPGGLRVFPLGDPAKDADADRYVRYIDTDPNLRMNLSTPGPGSVRHAETKIQEAMALMEAGDPDLAAEIKALLREIVLCSGREETGGYTFDGASTFLLWGAIFINANRRGDDLVMVQMLAHESAHNLLFALSPDEPLLNNDSAERYPSPLRDDPRPLEGIYHATFVLARMHRSLKQLLAGNKLSPAQQSRAEKDAEANARYFAQGMETLDAHADLTPTGRAILEALRAYELG